LPASHRPNLVLRRVTFERITEEHPEGRPLFKIEIANAGDSDAIIGEMSVAFGTFVGKDPVPWKLIELLEKNSAIRARENRVISGGSLALMVPADDVLAEAIAFNRVQSNLFAIFCVGYFRYTDTEGRFARRTGFLRRANMKERWFERENAPDFEYQD
jgi:hypothetical protein